ncbi:MAG: hypothetical protein ACJ76F_02245 [Bacteroidia bacterium]
MRVIQLNYFSLCILALSLLLSCKKKENAEVPDLGYDYYPATIGSYIEYDVDSTAYTPLPVDTIVSKFRIKEVIEEEITDNQGRPTLKIVRYKKNYSATVPYNLMTWTLQDVWTANKTKTTAEVVEENVRYVKLAFPVADDASWNGNAQNTMGDWEYKYSGMDSPSSYNGLSFEKTVLVNQKKYLTAISYQYYTEKYARGVGLIYKEIIDVKSTHNIGVPILNRIEEGVVYKQTIVDHN